MATVSAPVRRYLIVVRNAGSTVADLPPSTWMLVETCSSETAAQSRYFALRPFLEESGAPCLVIEAVKPVFGPEEFRVLVSRSAVLEKGWVPEAVRLSREQLAALKAAIEDASQRVRKGFGPLKARRRHAAAWMSALAGFVVTMVGITGFALWDGAPEPATVAAADAAPEPAGSLVVLPDGNAKDRFVTFRLLPDGTRTEERRINKAEYDALRARSGRASGDKEPPGASRTSSLAERASLFARVRSND
jgi:hypothetical protein